MPGRFSRALPNAISVLRIALTPLFVWSVVGAAEGGTGWSAAAAFSLIAASDVIDGRVARRLHAASAMGRALDHGADIAFLLSAFGAYVALGAAPWWVPASIAASFAVYVVDAARPGPRRAPSSGSRIGHLGGVANYVLVGVLVGNVTVGLHWLSAADMRALFASVPLYSGAAILSRMIGGARRQVLVPGRP